MTCWWIEHVTLWRRGCCLVVFLDKNVYGSVGGEWLKVEAVDSFLGLARRHDVSAVPFEELLSKAVRNRVFPVGHGGHLPTSINNE